MLKAPQCHRLRPIRIQRGQGVYGHHELVVLLENVLVHYLHHISVLKDLFMVKVAPNVL